MQGSKKSQDQRLSQMIPSKKSALQRSPSRPIRPKPINTEDFQVGKSKLRSDLAGYLLRSRASMDPS